MVLLGRVLFRYTEIGLAGVLFSSLFGGNGNALSSFAAETQLASNAFLLIAACVASTPLMKMLKERIERCVSVRPAAARAWSLLFYSLLPVALLLLSTACLVGDSYNPFIYFQF